MQYAPSLACTSVGAGGARRPASAETTVSGNGKDAEQDDDRGSEENDAWHVSLLSDDRHGKKGSTALILAATPGNVKHQFCS